MAIPRPVDDARGPLDFEHLRQATMGNSSLEREVLGMFSKQAEHLVATLGALPPETAALAHTLKGSARAIGAVRVADRAAEFEVALRDGGDVRQALAALDAAVAEARAAIEAILARP
jgi:HPt (histidine-containing phosphotransfer) domain-containing protein